jgi:DNA-binding NarL/FixJ family response regulator
VLALLTEQAPVLLVLEDVHWADPSTLDLAVYLAQNLSDRSVVLLATYRADEPSSADRIRRFAAGVRRSGAALVLELGPLDPGEMAALLGDAPPAVRQEIAARSEGNPFFAEELLAAAGSAGSGALPPGLRDVLLQRVARLDGVTQGVLRLAAAAGRDVDYPLLRATSLLPEGELRASLRAAVDHGVLVAEQSTGRFRFRHALLAEAVYATVLPGEREELHARLAHALEASATPAELAPHWATAGRRAEALVASVEAARQAQTVWALGESHAHLERALALWPEVPAAAALAQVDLAGLCAWAADVAWQAGAAPRAVELAEQAIDLDPPSGSVLYESLGRYLFASGRGDEALAAFERSVELVPAEPPSPGRARALAALGYGLMLAWRYEESLVICERALATARAVGATAIELQARPTIGVDLAYLGRADEGLAQLRLALRLAEEHGDPVGFERAYVELTDVLLMLGQPRESARLATEALLVCRQYGPRIGTLAANQVEALVASGDWDEADRASAAALRSITANYPHHVLISRGELEVGRGDFELARAHYDAARATLRLPRDLATFDTFLAELALWERRWTDAEQAVRDGLARARSREMAQIRVWLAAKGLRAQAELAALARARRDVGALRLRIRRARALLVVAQRAVEASAAVTPNAAGWLALAEAEYERAKAEARPELWSSAADTWHRLQRAPLVAYCRWRQAEALVAAGAPRLNAARPLREAHATAERIGARPLLREVELLAQRARLDLAPAEPALAAGDELEALGLTPREAEVLALLGRGLTNREIAAELVINVKTASVHVSNILRKLDAPNRREAAAIAHRHRPA